MMGEIRNLPGADTSDPDEVDHLDPDPAVMHATAMGWPVSRCGQPCGHVATAPTVEEVAVLVDAHRCGQPAPTKEPGITRLVVGCATFLIVCLLAMTLVEELAGVR